MEPKFLRTEASVVESQVDARGCNGNGCRTKEGKMDKGVNRKSVKMNLKNAVDKNIIHECLPCPKTVLNMLQPLPFSIPLRCL